MKIWPLLFILSFYSAGQSTFTIDETTYLLDDTLVFVRFTMEPLNGIIYDDSSRKIGLYVDGRREGVHTVWHDNDYLLVEAEYNYGTLNGQYKKFFPNGTLMEEAVYDLGVKNGVSRSYHKNGKLKTEDYYNQGIRDSLCRKWWLNGQLAFKKEFKSGLCITHMEWDINGRKTLDKIVDDLEEVVIIENEETPPLPAVSPPAPPPPVAPKVVKVVPPVEEFPDVEAQFPGGPVEMMKWINANVVYPLSSIEMNEQGRVFLSFVVEADGSITNVKVERGISSDLDCEAQRVVRSMPNWIPGENNGRKVRVRCRTPILFRLN